MRRLLLLPALAAANVSLVQAGGTEWHDFVARASTSTFYRPNTVQNLQIEAVGLVNEDIAYFATKEAVFRYHRNDPHHKGFVHKIYHLMDHESGCDGDEIGAFQLCHHRNSFFYETKSKDGGQVKLCEYFLQAEKTQKVWEHEDALPATSLACVDDFLLRASPEELTAHHLVVKEEEEKKVSKLFSFTAPDSPDVLTSLAVGHASDTLEHALVFAAAPHNHSIVRLHLAGSEQLVAHTEPLPLPGEAATFSPGRLEWVNGGLGFSDGCSVRWLTWTEPLPHELHVRTLLAADCVPPANETLQPVPWGSQLSVPAGTNHGTLGIASSSHTLDHDVLVLTGAQVLRTSWNEDGCDGHNEEAACVKGESCGWAEGHEHGEQLCLSCKALHEWATSQQSIELCSFHGASRAGTRYSLEGCGCQEVVPTASPPSEDGPALGAGQVLLVIIVVFAALVVAVLLYRAFRRAATMRELYGVDEAEFYTFTDEESSFKDCSFR